MSPLFACAPQLADLCHCKRNTTKVSEIMQWRLEATKSHHTAVCGSFKSFLQCAGVEVLRACELTSIFSIQAHSQARKTSLAMLGRKDLNDPTHCRWYSITSLTISRVDQDRIKCPLVHPELRTHNGGRGQVDVACVVEIACASLESQRRELRFPACVRGSG